MGMLPQLPNEYAERAVTDTFLGYNHNAKINDGEFYFAKNLTTAYAPLMSVRKKRGLVSVLNNPGGIIAKDKLAYVDDGTLFYDGKPTAVNGLSAGEKQLVSMGAHIVIFPDKVYFNTADPADHGSLEATYTSTGAVKYSLCMFDGTDYGTPVVSKDAPANPQNASYWIDTSKETHVLKQWSASQNDWVSIPTVYTKLSFISQGEVSALFKEYDGVTISGSTVDDVNGEKVLYSVGGSSSSPDYVVVIGLLEQAVTQSTGYVKLERKVPDLDYVCECQNRLWGCYYGGEKSLNEIYCCALGDFKNWRQYMGLSTDSWTGSCGSDGKWTGAINYMGNPIFFKEDRLHRVTVSAEGAHRIADTVCQGVQEGCSKSLVVVNDTLFYKSRAGVVVYQGSFPVSISEAFGDVKYSDAVAGGVDDLYYVSMKDDKDVYSLFVFDKNKRLWMREDDLNVEQFAKLGNELYCIAGKKLLALNGTNGDIEPYVEWEAETGMLYYQYPDRKYVQRYNFRMQMEEGADLDIYIMYDSSGEWVRHGKIKMKGTKTVTIPIRPRRCDHMRLRLTGKGDFKLYSIAKILTYGSDIR